MSSATGLPVALLQLNPTVGDLAGNVRRIADAARSAHAAGARVAVAPELPGWTPVALKPPMGFEFSISVNIAPRHLKRAEFVLRLREHHRDAPTLVIGTYLQQLELIAGDLEAPLVTGDTPQADRERLFKAFREGGLRTLVLSKVGNFALELPAGLGMEAAGIVADLNVTMTWLNYPGRRNGTARAAEVDFTPPGGVR